MMKKKLPIEIETGFEFDSYTWVLKLLRYFSPLFRKHLYQVTYKYKRNEAVELNVIDLLKSRSVFMAGFDSKQFDSIENPEDLDLALENFAENWLKEMLPILYSLYNTKIKLNFAPGSRLLSMSKFLYSAKNQKEVFYPIISDWHEEYFEVLSKKEIWKARLINARYSYAFLAAMWQKSPIGDLIEFVVKIAKK